MLPQVMVSVYPQTEKKELKSFTGEKTSGDEEVES
jgi:hypothetical protein